MADRASASTFAWLLSLLAEYDTTIPRDELVDKVWGKLRSKDFHPCQMEIDDALIKLGLARKYPGCDDYEYEIQYMGEAGFKE